MFEDIVSNTKLMHSQYVWDRDDILFLRSFFSYFFSEKYLFVSFYFVFSALNFEISKRC